MLEATVGHFRDSWQPHCERLAEHDAIAFNGRPFPLVDNQLVIRKPKDLAAALSILTTYTSERRRAPYEDALGADGLLRYKYEGTARTGTPMSGCGVRTRRRSR